MKVKELIQKLSKLDEDLEVMLDVDEYLLPVETLTELEMVENKRHKGLYHECIKGEPDMKGVVIE